ncbi:phage tail assembly chaperone [Parasphingorhabdus sp.]|uniref:phage tail assembly chaperone n=1 Tax=Parasphingorhabdus sp. TaxID=2709688 RepID=UPI003297DD91
MAPQECSDFCTSAAHLAGLIPATVGWTPDQFWAATPAELTAILTAFSAASPVPQNTEPLDKTQLQKLKETLNHG